MRFVGKDTIGNDLKTGQYGINYFYNDLAVDGSGNINYCDYLKTGVQLLPSVVSTVGSYDLVYDPSDHEFAKYIMTMWSQLTEQAGYLNTDYTFTDFLKSS